MNRTQEASVQSRIGEAKEKAMLIATDGIQDYMDKVYVKNTENYSDGGINTEVVNKLNAEGPAQMPHEISIIAQDKNGDNPAKVIIYYSKPNSGEAQMSVTGTIQGGRITWGELKYDAAEAEEARRQAEEQERNRQAFISTVNGAIKAQVDEENKITPDALKTILATYFTEESMTAIASADLTNSTTQAETSLTAKEANGGYIVTISELLTGVTTVNPTPIVDPTTGIGAVNETYKGDIGKRVNGYKPLAGGMWYLYYVDDSRAYLISRVGYGEAGHPGGVSSLPGWDNNTLTKSNVSTLGKNLNGKFTEWDSQANNINLKGVAALLDPSAWVDFKTDDALWAIGAPTLEIYAASYNATHKKTQIETIVEDSSATGYKMRASRKFSYMGQTVWNTGSYSDYLDNMQESNNSLSSFYFRRDTLLASPSAADSTQLVHAEHTSGGFLGSSGYGVDVSVGNGWTYWPVVAVPISVLGNEITFTNETW